jgi:hypothetical protein
MYFHWDFISCLKIFSFSSRDALEKGRKNKTTGDPELSVLSSISIQQLQQKNLFHSCLKNKTTTHFFFFKTYGSAMFEMK